MMELVRKFTYKEAMDYIQKEEANLAWYYEYHTSSLFHEMSINTSWFGKPSIMMRYHQDKIRELNKKQKKLMAFKSKISSNYNGDIIYFSFGSDEA